MTGDLPEEVVFAFRFDTIAQEQLAEAVEYYNEHANEEISKRFLLKVETVVEMLCAWPEIGATLDGYPAVRSCKVPKYPYRIYYRIDNELLEIIAISVYHSRRDLDKLVSDLKKRLGKYTG